MLGTIIEREEILSRRLNYQLVLFSTLYFFLSSFNVNLDRFLHNLSFTILPDYLPFTHAYLSLYMH